jgi:hypothetical protein
LHAANVEKDPGTVSIILHKSKASAGIIFNNSAGAENARGGGRHIERDAFARW